MKYFTRQSDVAQVDKSHKWTTPDASVFVNGSGGRSILILLLTQAGLAGCSGAPIRQDISLRIDSATAPVRWSDSALVRLHYTAPGSCADMVVADTQVIGETVRVELSLGEANLRCEGRSILDTLEFVVPIPMRARPRVVASQPDGTETVWEAPAVPRRPCPGPDVWMDWGTGSSRAEYDVGQEYRLELHVCREYSRPLLSTWTVADTTIADLDQLSDSTALLIPRRAGTSRVTVGLPDGRRIWEADIVILPGG